MARFVQVLALLVVGFCMLPAVELSEPNVHSVIPPAARLSDLALMGVERVQYDAFERYVLTYHAEIDLIYLRTLYTVYVESAATEGVNLLVALSQMLHETGFLRFGGAVRAVQYNFAGIGSVGPGITGNSFPDLRTGVRAHIQHLRAYADLEPLVGELVDPRFHLVVRGSARTVRALTGRWATDPLYGEKVLVHAHRLREIDRWTVPLRGQQ